MNNAQAAFPSHLKKSTTAILGVGTALPMHAVTQEDACLFAQQAGLTKRYRKALEMLYKQSGVKQRHSVLLERTDAPLMERQSFFPVLSADPSLDDPSKSVPTTADRMTAYRKFAAPLAIEAATRAIEKSEVSAKSFTHLITVSCSGFAAPGVDFALINALGLSPEIQRTHVGFMGCHASLNAIRVARAICESNRNARVLLCAVELCTIHQQYTDDPQQLVANSLFGDGAAAIVLQSNVEDVYDSAGRLGGLASGWTVIDNASIVLENTSDMMSWHVGDFGFEMGLSPKVPEIIVERLKPWLESWLTKHNLVVSEIANWLVHPGGPRILSAVQDSLQLEENSLSTSWNVLRHCGNMSSPTVLFILQQHSDVALPGPTVMLGFGPGLVTEACLLHRS